MTLRSTSAVWSALVALTLSSGSAAEPSASELASALQKKYDGIKSFTADFVHGYRGGVLNRQLNQSGRLLIKKPGKMRWDYETPEKKLFVSDGSKIQVYVPADRQVIVSDVTPGETATSPALFLAGRGNLTRDFNASKTELPAGSAPGGLALKLIPKVPQSDYDWLVLVVDPATLALRGLAYGDAQGGTSTFSFTNLKENAGIADNAFDFRPPRGVDVVTDSPAR
jgi:outer membrane lipoprotein carrier protein